MLKAHRDNTNRYYRERGGFDASDCTQRFFMSGGNVKHSIDPVTHQRKEGCLEDMLKAIVAGNALKNVERVSGFLIPHEYEPKLADIVQFYLLSLFSRKRHFFTYIYSLPSAKCLIEYELEPVGHLQFARENIEIAAEFARNGMKIATTHWGWMGCHSPVTYASLLALTNAHILAGAAALVALNPKNMFFRYIFPTHSVKPGDRVGVEPLHPCTCFGESCPMCRRGDYHLCVPGLSWVGMPIGRFPMGGGYGEYVLAHESRVFRIPDSLSFPEACILDNLAVEVHALKIGDPQIGETVAVMGCGIVGLEMIQCLRARGLREIIAIAKHPHQAALAKRLGASEIVILETGRDEVKEVMRLTAGSGVDQVYECVGGHTDAVAHSLEMCAKGGKVVMIGGAPKTRPIDLQAMLLREVNLLPCMSYSNTGTRRDFQIAIDLLREGLVDHRCLITHSFDPLEYRSALQTAMSKGPKGVGKVVVVRE